MKPGDVIGLMIGASKTIPDFICTTSEIQKIRYNHIKSIIILLTNCIEDEIIDPYDLYKLDLQVSEFLNLLEDSCSLDSNGKTTMIVIFLYLVEVLDFYKNICVEHSLFESAHNLSEIKCLNI